MSRLEQAIPIKWIQRVMQCSTKPTKSKAGWQSDDQSDFRNRSAAEDRARSAPLVIVFLARRSPWRPRMQLRGSALD